MISRSASVPAFGGVLADGDRCDFSPLRNAGLRGSQPLFPVKLVGPLGSPFKPLHDLRRARSQIELRAVLHEADVSDVRSVRKTQRHLNAENLSTRQEPIVLVTDEARPSFAEDDAENRNAGIAGASNRQLLVADEEGNCGGRGGKRIGPGRANWPKRNSHGPGSNRDPADTHYTQMLQSDPQNPLLLRNYAQFLSKMKNDYKRAEEYYERAILACPSDGEVLSMYAKHVWDVHKDAERAGDYFDRAVEATPDDCYILGSHAFFLWQSEDDEESSDVSKPLGAPLQTMISDTDASLVVSC